MAEDRVDERIGPTVEPLLEREHGRDWRHLAISDARISRRNDLYSLPPDRRPIADAHGGYR